MIFKLNIWDYRSVGRLGNNLFQIATGIGQSRYNDIILPKGKWKYEKYFPNLTYKDDEEVDKLLSLYPQVTHIEPLPGGRKHDFPSDENINLHIEGYFQVEEYFNHKASLIREKLRFESNFYSSCKLSDIVKGRVVGVHVRRGDVEDLERFGNDRERQNATFPIPTAEYFKECMKRLDNEADYFFICSDDIQWCKDNLQSPKSLFSKGVTDIEDFCMLTQCKHIITSNSTFSWWAAWLTDNDEKKVYTMNRWFGSRLTETNLHVDEGVVPKKWIRI
jgi:hypothetical protein